MVYVEAQAELDEPAREAPHFVEATVGHVGVEVLDDRPVHGGEAVVAGKGELGLGMGQAQKKGWVTVVQPPKSVADQGSHRCLVHSVTSCARALRL